MSLGFSAWPDKLPAEVLVVKEQWDKAKAKSTKSAQGRFVWNLGRSAMAAMIAFQLIPVDIDGGFMRLAFIAGFGLAAGFFGARDVVVCASDIFDRTSRRPVWLECRLLESGVARAAVDNVGSRRVHVLVVGSGTWPLSVPVGRILWADGEARQANLGGDGSRSEEHTSELQSLMRISYDVFCMQ